MSLTTKRLQGIPFLRPTSFVPLPAASETTKQFVLFRHLGGFQTGHNLLSIR